MKKYQFRMSVTSGWVDCNARTYHKYLRSGEFWLVRVR